MTLRNTLDRNRLIGAAILIAMIVTAAALLFASGARFSYTLRTVTIGGVLLGILSGVVGSFAVLRKQSLLGDALSHAALPGVGIAFLLFGRHIGVLLLGAAGTSLLGIWFISLIVGSTRLKQDSAMGIVLAGWFAVGIGILTFIQQRSDASQAGLDTFIFGQAAAIVAQDVRILGAVTILVFAILILNWKEFKLVTFDAEFAGANGFRVGLITAVLLGLVVVTVVMGLQLAGVVLMAGLLIAPGVAARQWTDRLGRMTLLAGFIGGLSGGIGSIVSALDTDLPTGPMIILTVSAFVVVSLLLAPGRGVVWTLIRNHRDRRSFAAGGNTAPVPHQDRPKVAVAADEGGSSDTGGEYGSD